MLVARFRQELEDLVERGLYRLDRHYSPVCSVNGRDSAGLKLGGRWATKNWLLPVGQQLSGVS